MSVQSEVMSELRAALNGRVIVPEDKDYERARTIFYGGIDRRPQAIVRVADPGDVAHVISLARQSGLELAVRGGGHSFAGHSLSDGGIVLDLRELRDLQLDPGRRTAWAGGGLTAGAYTKAAGELGLASYAFLIPDEAGWLAVFERLQAQTKGSRVVQRDQRAGLALEDQDGITVELLTPDTEAVRQTLARLQQEA